MNGPISVWELGRERHLVFAEELTYPQSVIVTKGSWSELQREYWGRMVQPPFEVPHQPRVLVLGLGGGTVVHLAHRLLHPGSITAVELDPMVVQVARSYMGLNDIPNLDIRVADVHVALMELRNDKKFDLIIEDVFHLGLPTNSADSVKRYISSLTDLLALNGGIIFNRWFGREREAMTEQFSRFLNEWFTHVERKRVVQRWRNETIFASGFKKGLGKRESHRFIDSWRDSMSVWRIGIDAICRRSFFKTLQLLS